MTRKASYKNSKRNIECVVVNPDRIPIQLGLKDPDPGRPEKQLNIGGKKYKFNFL